jgi:thiaminase/transcriptional activator TenA
VFHVERSLHLRLAQRLGCTLDGVEMAPTAYAYTRHLLAVGYAGTVAEILGAVLPCYWIYADIGCRLAQNPPEDPIYADWITTYNLPVFKEATACQVERMDRLAAQAADAERCRIAEYFCTSSRYEYLFWDMAYRLEAWPV